MKKYKLEIMKDYYTQNGVGISSSFMVRAACKYCGKGPTFHYTSSGTSARAGTVHDMKTSSKFSRSWMNSMSEDWGFEASPRYMRVSDIGFHLWGRAYLPACHHSRKPLGGYVERMNDIMSCECGKTGWQYREPARHQAPEVKNRKGRYNYPQKT